MGVSQFTFNSKTYWLQLDFQKKKKLLDGFIEKYKARLVAKGFSKKQNVDYFDMFTPVTRVSSIRILIVLASIHKIFIHQMDVNRFF